jgi:hypothetical protein
MVLGLAGWFPALDWSMAPVVPVAVHRVFIALSLRTDATLVQSAAGPLCTEALELLR